MKLKKMLLAGLILMGVNTIFSDCFIEEAAGKYIIGNQYIKVGIDPGLGGSISDFEFSPLNIKLSQTDGNSLEEEFNSQHKKDGKTIIYTESVGKRKFTPEILKNSSEEVQLKLSVAGGSAEFAWLGLSKTYSLKKDSSALKVDYLCRNNTDQEHQLGLRTKSFFRKSGFFPEKNIFITPTCEGIREIEHPGTKATIQGDYHMSPAAGWEAVVGAADGSGMLVIVDNSLLSCFFNWYRNSGFLSTLEWYLNEQTIKANASFSTSVTLVPLVGMKRIDGVIGEDIACGILPEGKVCFNSPAKISLDVKIGKESAKKVELLPSQLAALDFAPVKSGIIEVSVYKGKELLGKVERSADDKEISRKEPPGKGAKALAPVYYRNPHSPEAEGITVQKLASVEKGSKGDSQGRIEKTVLRQFENSVAEAYIPPGEMRKAGNEICVFDADSNTEVKSFLKKEADGSGIVYWEVKGLGGRATEGKEKDGVLYDKKGEALGKIEQKYSIVLGKKPENTGTFEDGANMVPNASFEEDYSDFYKRSKELISVDEKVAKFGKRSLKLTKREKDNYISVPFWGIVEGGKNYDISVWLRQNSTGTALVTLPVYFYDKDWKHLKDDKGAQWRKYVMKQTGSFEWKKFSGVIQSPENARFIQISLSGRPEAGGALWVDDVCIKPQLVKASGAMEQELAKIKSSTYKTIDEIFAISEDFVTRHKKWLKPKSGKKTDVLWLTSMKYVSEVRKRETVEMAQRMDMNYQFIPLLPRMLTPPRAILGMNTGDTYGTVLEPYILMLLRKELTKRKRDVIVVQDLKFKGSTLIDGLGKGSKPSAEIESVQAEFTELLLGALKEGSSIVFYNCQDIPGEFLGNKVKTPEGFLIMPELRKIPANRVAAICTLANYGKGRIAVVENNQALYPCVPREKGGDNFYLYYDHSLRSFPYIEYKYAPFIKAIRWASGEKPKAVIDKISFNNGKLNFTVSSIADGDYAMTLDYGDIYRHDLGSGKEKISLKKGINELSFEVPSSLPGGKNIADCRIVDGEGKICDFGSIAFDLAEECKVQSVDFSQKERIYRLGEEIKAQIKLDGDLKDAELVCEVEDGNNRIVDRIKTPARKSAEISFKLKEPYTILYRLFIKVQRGDKVLSQRMAEFSYPCAYPATDDLTAYIWGGGTWRLLVLKDVGFEVDVVSFVSAGEQHLRALCNMGVRGVTSGSGSLAGVSARSPYKSDSATKDPVRKPCLSNPELWKKVRPLIHEAMKKNKHFYYGIRDNFVNDEFSLGASVCISEYCLHDFREYLKKQYSSVSQLNKAWKTSFKDWQEIVPLPVKDVSIEKDNIAAWLDHRIFMNNVYAYTWLGRTKEYLNEVNPEAKVGPSGTLNPGYSMAWYKVMQNTDFLAYYGGIQVGLISSFANPGTVYGQWGGGYVPSHMPYERNVCSKLWEGILGQNNAYMYFHGATGTTMRGDLQMTVNMKYCAEELMEAKAGPAKLILSSRRADLKIAVLYSQSSMFAATATVGKEYWDSAMDSWKSLLDDLKYNYRFISSEQLTGQGLDANQYKVLILPCALSLSARETEKISEFVKNGGTLIADFAPGIFDEHGTKSTNPELQSILGVKRTEYVLNISSCDEKINAANTLNLPAGKYVTRFAEKSLKLTTGKSLGDTGTPAAPGLILNQTGKGKSIFMNNLINGYSLVTLKGDGGELSEELKGPEFIREMTRGIIGQLLKGSGLSPLFSIKTQDGKIYPSTGAVFEDGKNQYVGIIKPAAEPGVIDMKKEAIGVTVAFPRKAHIYDVRKGEYLGESTEIRTSVVPAIAKIYALLPYKVAGVQLDGLSGEYKRGASIEATVKVLASSGKAGNHVIRFEAVSSDRKTVKCYSQNLKIVGGEGKIIWNTALSDMPGKWTLKIKDIASGITGAGNVTLSE